MEESIAVGRERSKGGGGRKGGRETEGGTEGGRGREGGLLKLSASKVHVLYRQEHSYSHTYVHTYKHIHTMHKHKVALRLDCHLKNVSRKTAT